MTNPRKIVVLTILGLLEIVFLSWALASNLPRRESELAASRAIKVHKLRRTWNGGSKSAKFPIRK
jgi:hypothetical protein